MRRSVAAGLAAIVVLSTASVTADGGPAETDAGGIHESSRPLVAHEDIDRSVVVAEMEGMLDMPLSDFVALRREQLGQDGPALYDWSSDGCTSFIGTFLDDLDQRFDRFEPACIRHDWGYRNFGSVNIRGFDADERRRALVDERMREDMQAICERDDPASRMCLAEAELVFRVLRLGGHLSFYGFLE